jgi:hypothetical protein
LTGAEHEKLLCWHWFVVRGRGRRIQEEIKKKSRRNQEEIKKKSR